MIRDGTLLLLLFCLALLTGCGGATLPLPWPPMATSAILSPTPRPTIDVSTRLTATPLPTPRRLSAHRKSTGPRCAPTGWRRQTLPA